MNPVALLLLTFAAAEPAALHRYDVRIDPALERLEARACFADGLPARLIADHPVAADATLEFRYLRDGAMVTASPRSNAVILPTPSDDGCIEWTTDLGSLAAVDRMNIGYRAGDSLILAPGTWFWRPPVLTANRDIELRFKLSEGMRISVPWQPLEADDQATQRFRRGHSPFGWPALMAIGKLETARFEVAGSVFRLAITDGPARTEIALVRRWLQPAARAVAQLTGAFPANEMQLLVVPVEAGYDAAPWAETRRGGGAAAHFFMNATASWPVFRDDWIAVHELVHFALPFVQRRDAWLSEGFASYYQHVLRARAGMLTPGQAWQELHDGFMRGHRNTGADTLRDDTLRMRARGRVMRVYWSGAAIAFLADVELRRRSQGEWSLDRVIDVFNRCCRETERTWSAREVFAAFDEITKTDVFDTLYRTNVYSRHFPRLAETRDALGITINGKEVSLDDDAPHAAIRIAIMQPRAASEDATASAGPNRTTDR